MKKPPLWKVKRELKRFGRQIVAAPALLAEYLFVTWHYDLTREKHLKRFQGTIAESPRIAIYLIFPSTGLLRSHLMALDYLVSKGYAPLVVSNLPLSEEDRARLLSRCWSYLERPNVGYDFGGYRDAVLELAPRLATLDRLAIFNDSSWFPLPGARDWLDDVEALEVDFAGASSHFGTPRPDLETLRDLRWSFDTGHRNFHYASYALVLRPAAFRHPDFLSFWRRMRSSASKGRTVRRGEIGLSRWAIRHGLSHGATLDVSQLDKELSALPEQRLHEIAKAAIVADSPHFRILQARALADQPSRATLIALILYAVTRHGAGYALAPYSIPHRGHPFLKKSPVWLERASSDTTLQIAEGLEGPDGKVILEEARELRRTKGARLDAPEAT